MLSTIIPHLWYLSEVRRRQEAEQALRETKAQLAAATARRRR